MIYEVERLFPKGLEAELVDDVTLCTLSRKYDFNDRSPDPMAVLREARLLSLLRQVNLTERLNIVLSDHLRENQSIPPRQKGKHSLVGVVGSKSVAYTLFRTRSIEFNPDAGNSMVSLDQNFRIDSRKYSIGMKAYLGLLLAFDSAPAVHVTFRGTDERKIRIEQFQGIRPMSSIKPRQKPIYLGNTPGIEYLHAFELLAHLVESFSHEVGYEKVEIVGASNVSWTRQKYDDGTAHLPLERARRIYDKTARNRGYNLTSHGDWIKEL